MGAVHEQHETHTPVEDSFVIRAWLSVASDDDDGGDDDDDFRLDEARTKLELQLVIAEDDAAEGTYRVSCTRILGETLRFHKALRRLGRTLGLASGMRAGADTQGRGIAAPPMRAAAGCGGALACGMEMLRGAATAQS